MSKYDLSNKKDIEILTEKLIKNLSDFNIDKAQLIDALSKISNDNNTEKNPKQTEHPSYIYLEELLNNGTHIEIVGFILSNCEKDIRDFHIGFLGPQSLDLLYCVSEYFVYKRNHCKFKITLERFRKAFCLPDFFMISQEKDLPDNVKDAFQKYLDSLPEILTDETIQYEHLNDIHGYSVCNFARGFTFKEI